MTTATEETLPERLIKPVLAFLAPTYVPTVEAFIAQAGISAIIAWLTTGMGWVDGLPLPLMALTYSVMLDYVTGLYAGCRDESGFSWAKFSWRRGFEGIVRKAIMALVVAGVWVVGMRIGPAAEQIISMLVWIMVINEGGSIVMNLRKANFTVDPMVDDVLARARRQFEMRNDENVPHVIVEVKKEQEP